MSSMGNKCRVCGREIPLDDRAIDVDGYLYDQGFCSTNCKRYKYSSAQLLGGFILAFYGYYIIFNTVQSSSQNDSALNFVLGGIAMLLVGGYFVWTGYELKMYIRSVTSE